MVAEVATLLKGYDESGLVDYISLDLWIKNALKEFGGNLMERQEGTIEVVDGKATLPENFYSLSLAMKCDLVGVACDEETKKYLQSSFFYRERTEKQEFWDNQVGAIPCEEGEECKTVVEEIYWHDKGKSAKFYYDNVQILKLVPGYKRNRCDKGCPNLNEYKSPYEISDQGGYLQCNFNSGYIYLRYKGLPVDEEGELVIPEIQRNKLTDYIKYTCVRRTLEAIYTSDDDPNTLQKLQYFTNMEKESYAASKNDSIVEGMLGWKERFKNKNRRYTRKFELMYSNL